jgi:RecB family exonuclease
MQKVATRTLIRARGTAAFRDALVACARAGSAADATRRAVVIPTHAAAALLRETIEARLRAEAPAAILPSLLTREDLLARLREALPGARPLLSRVEREVLFERAAIRTARRPSIGGAPFRLRPGLIAALLDFYDELNRRQRRVRRFARVLFDQLRVERGTDRGSESLVHQTAFMGLMFLAYERSLADAGALDEHALRQALISAQPVLPFDHLVVAVADHPSDPRGLWPADFDLIGRLRGFQRVDVVVTDETHDAGFRDRIERELPGIEERRHAVEHETGVLVRPVFSGAATASPECFISRDREDELRDAARMIRRRAEHDETAAGETAAIVCHRPLPYVYVAHQVLTAEGMSYEVADGLPLAGQPSAAMVDLVIAFARTGGTREAATALLRCGLLRFEVEGAAVQLADVSALSQALAGRRATGEADTYVAEVAAWFADRPTRDRARRAGAVAAARAAASIRAGLAPYRHAPSSSARVRAVTDFIRGHEVPVSDADGTRHRRARGAVLAALDALADAYAAHDDRTRDEAEITAAIRHAIEGRLFAPRRDEGGVRIVDAAAVRFGEFDHVHVVGLVESDWPQRPRRSIFFTSGLLKSLGWPQEADELRAQQAAFRDLLGVAARTTTLHAFEREGDAVAAVSPMVASLVADAVGATSAPIGNTAHAGSTDTGARDAGSPFLALRRARPRLDDRAYSGFVSARAPGAYRVSAVDRYVDCPFKYFAETVLQLPQEREAAPGLTPIERGTLIHDLFERFYRTWEAQGGGTITAATLPSAINLFAQLVHAALAALPETDRVLETTRLLGSIVARGIADRVFELEADAGGRVVRRLVEYELRGPFDFPRPDGEPPMSIAIRGKADRIDVFADGTLRVVDYKLGGLPDLDASVQVAVYAHAARARFERGEGRSFAIRSASYLAFGDDRRLEGAIGDRQTPPDAAVTARAAAFAGHVVRIEAGVFPPKPRRPADCRWCGVAGVCRKEYVADVDDAAHAV